MAPGSWFMTRKKGARRDLDLGGPAPLVSWSQAIEPRATSLELRTAEMLVCVQINYKKTCTSHKTHTQNKTKKHIATHDGLSAEPINTLMHIASKTQKQKLHI